MAPTGHWWILCALCLSCFGSYRRGSMADGAQPELFIFNELCALKDETGVCKAALDRFFFNVDTGRCELFEYGGCGGNENNFKTLEACEETCVVSDDKNPCHLPEAPGPCRGLVKRFFFDTRTQQCRHFYYGGCFGNANNFRSMEECHARCQNPERPTRAPEVQIVSAEKHSGEKPIKVTGELALSEPQVQTNDTIQDTEELTPAELCSSPVESGTCNGAERRYAFNPRTRRCHVFSYTGCGGNKNNFLSRKDCVKKCRKVRTIRIRRKNIDLIARHAV